MKDLGSTIDKLYELRDRRLGIERSIKEMKQQEYALRAEVLTMLGEAGLQKASGALATCGVTTTEIPLVSDWSEVHTYIRENNRFDLLQKRISVLAWRDLKESGVLVPGTESIEDVDISLTKASRSI